MAFGGGSYTDYNKFLPGTYTNYITIGQAPDRYDRGVVAGGLILDWGPDSEVFEITSDEFQDRAVELTGHRADDDSNILIREVFRHAKKLVAYRLNSKGCVKASHESVGEAACAGGLGNNITVTCYENVDNEGNYDVSTYYDGTLVDIQTVPGVTKVVERHMSVELKEKTDADISGKDEIKDVTVAFEADGGKVTGTYSKIPEGYEPYTQLMLGQMVCATVPGRIEITTKGRKVTLELGPDAAWKADYTLKLGLRKTADSERTVISSQVVKATLHETEAFGADTDLLENNPFVNFNPKSVVPAGAGYVFEGGRGSETVTRAAHADMLLQLEDEAFNALVCDVSDLETKRLYAEFTKRMRYERGHYFQMVAHNFTEPDDEGAISVYNAIPAAGRADGVKESSIVWWLAGYSSAVELRIDLTNKPYDGELKVSANLPLVQMEALKKRGQFLMHKVSREEVYTLFDINTLTTLKEGHGRELSENKVVRIVDYIHNEEAYELNRKYIGNVSNDEEGRTAIWNCCCSILNALQNEGAISDFNEKELTVSPVQGNKHAVKVDQRFRVPGTIYYVYITTYVVE